MATLSYRPNASGFLKGVSVERRIPDGYRGKKGPEMQQECTIKGSHLENGLKALLNDYSLSGINDYGGRYSGNLSYEFQVTSRLQKRNKMKKKELSALVEELENIERRLLRVKTSYVEKETHVLSRFRELESCYNGALEGNRTQILRKEQEFGYNIWNLGKLTELVEKEPEDKQRLMRLRKNLDYESKVLEIDIEKLKADAEQYSSALEKVHKGLHKIYGGKAAALERVNDKLFAIRYLKFNTRKMQKTSVASWLRKKYDSAKEKIASAVLGDDLDKGGSLGLGLQPSYATANVAGKNKGLLYKVGVPVFIAATALSQCIGGNYLQGKMNAYRKPVIEEIVAATHNKTESVGAEEKHNKNSVKENSVKVPAMENAEEKIVEKKYDEKTKIVGNTEQKGDVVYATEKAPYTYWKYDLMDGNGNLKGYDSVGDRDFCGHGCAISDNGSTLLDPLALGAKEGDKIGVTEVPVKLGDKTTIIKKVQEPEWVPVKRIINLLTGKTREELEQKLVTVEEKYRYKPFEMQPSVGTTYIEVM